MYHSNTEAALFACLSSGCVSKKGIHQILRPRLTNLETEYNFSFALIYSKQWRS